MYAEVYNLTCAPLQNGGKIMPSYYIYMLAIEIIGFITVLTLLIYDNLRG